MRENVPKWMTDLALDIYKVVQKRGAMDRFREMVDKWASEHEADINNHLRWQERKREYFQQLSSGDPRLLDEDAGPPEQGWVYEIYVLHSVADPPAGSEIRSTTINGWVPPQLSVAAEPEIHHPLPLSADHQLSLEEKYLILAAVYDVGRKGTEQIPRWEWPRDWGEEGAVSNAKKAIFLVSLRRDVLDMSVDDEGWLRTWLDCVKNDIQDQTGQKAVSGSKDMAPDGTRVERCIRKAKNHPVMSILIIVGVVIIALGAVAGGLDAIINFWDKHISGHDVSQETPRQDVFEQPIASAAASLEIDVRSAEQVNAHNMTVGMSLAFGREREGLLVMTSEDSHARQIGDSTVRYSGNLRMALTDKAFNQPLSILRDAQFIQLRVGAIPPNSEILSGTVNFAFNDGIPVRVTVPPQKMPGTLIMIRDVDFAALLKEQ
jgi:hypothetical protein